MSEIIYVKKVSLESFRRLLAPVYLFSWNFLATVIKIKINCLMSYISCDKVHFVSGGKYSEY